MGMDIGIISINYLQRPRGVVYEFAQHMAAEGAFNAYMFGEGGSWIPFSLRQTLRLLADYAREHNLSKAQREEIRRWLATLPWFGDSDVHWQDGEDEEGEDTSPVIELHFNW